jgi:uncharacterized membrane protein HdeD (DUF308 family)
MLQLMAKNWWAVVLRGVFAILFGVLAWTLPGVTLGALVLLWGAYAFVDGILALVAAFSGAAGRPWWVLALEGIVGLGAAAATVLYPGITAIVLLYLIAAWAMVTGIFEIAAAIRLRKEIEGEFWLGLAIAPKGHSMPGGKVKGIVSSSLISLPAVSRIYFSSLPVVSDMTARRKLPYRA